MLGAETINNWAPFHIVLALKGAAALQIDRPTLYIVTSIRLANIKWEVVVIFVRLKLVLALVLTIVTFISEVVFIGGLQVGWGRGRAAHACTCARGWLGRGG